MRERNSIFSDRERFIINYVTDPEKWGTKDEISKALHYIAGALVAAFIAWRTDTPSFYLVGYGLLIYCIWIHIGATWEILRSLPQIIEKYEKLISEEGVSSVESVD